MANKIRGRNEGYIGQRKDGRWQARLSRPNGTPQCFYGVTKADVVKKLKAAQQAVARGLPIPSQTETLASYLPKWLANSHIRPGTWKNYESHIRNHILGDRARGIKPDVIASTRLIDLTPTALNQYFARRMAAGCSATQVNYLRVLIRAALAAAMRDELIHRNVAQLTLPQKTRKRKIVPPGSAELVALLSGLAGDALEALHLVTLACGARKAEALGICESDLEIDAVDSRGVPMPVIHLRHQLQRINGEYQLVDMKTADSERDVQLPPYVLSRLREHLDRQKFAQRNARNKWVGNPWGLVFTTAAGKPLSGDWLTHKFQSQLAAMGLPRQRYHDLRHAAATLLNGAGASMKDVKDLLGHSQIAHTANLYTHASSESATRIAELMQGILEAASPKPIAQ